MALTQQLPSEPNRYSLVIFYDPASASYVESKEEVFSSPHHIECDMRCWHASRHILVTLQQNIRIKNSLCTNMAHLRKFISQLARTAAALERSDLPIHLGLTILQSGVVQSRGIATTETIITPTLTSFCEKSTLTYAYMPVSTHTHAHTHARAHIAYRCHGHLHQPLHGTKTGQSCLAVLLAEIHF